MVMFGIETDEYDVQMFDATPPSPGLGGLIPGVAPGAFVSEPQPGQASGGVGSSPGRLTIVLLVLITLALVGFNVSSKSFRA